MSPDQQTRHGLFKPDESGLTSTSSMTNMEREELRRLATLIETEKEPEAVIAVAQEMNDLLDRILARIPKAPAKLDS